MGHLESFTCNILPGQGLWQNASKCKEVNSAPKRGGMGFSMRDRNGWENPLYVNWVCIYFDSCDHWENLHAYEIDLSRDFN